MTEHYDLPARAEPEILTAKEAAEFLRIGRNQLYDLAGRGELPYRRLGRSLRFSRSALIRWMDSRHDGTMGSRA